MEVAGTDKEVNEREREREMRLSELKNSIFRQTDKKKKHIQSSMSQRMKGHNSNKTPIIGHEI